MPVGRPPGREHDWAVMVYLDKETHKKLKRFVKENELTLSSAIRLSIKRQLKEAVL